MIDLIIIAVLLVVTYFTGSMIEKRHFKRIRDREDALLEKVYVVDHFSARDGNISKMQMVDGSCVLGADKFKVFLGGFISLFGGRIAVFENLIDRCRREAILRMREKAMDADMIVCTRIQFAELNSNQIETLAYGTAIYLEK